MQRTFVYKLRPTDKQQDLLTDTLRTCRHLYNDCLAQRRAAWEERQETLCFAQQCASLPVRKQTDPLLARVHSQVLQDVLHRVERSYQHFFRRLREGKQKPGLPRFKGQAQWGNGDRLPAVGRACHSDGVSASRATSCRRRRVRSPASVR